MKKAKKKVAAKKTEKAHITDLSILGKRIHPVVGTVGGAAVTPLGGVFAIFGTIFAVAGAIALVRGLMKKSSKK